MVGTKNMTCLEIATNYRQLRIHYALNCSALSILSMNNLLMAHIWLDLREANVGLPAPQVCHGRPSSPQNATTTIDNRKSPFSIVALKQSVNGMSKISWVSNVACSFTYSIVYYFTYFSYIYVFFIGILGHKIYDIKTKSVFADKYQRNIFQLLNRAWQTWQQNRLFKSSNRSSLKFLKSRRGALTNRFIKNFSSAFCR